MNEATDFERSTVSNEEGLFSFPLVQPGVYSVIAEMNAFKPPSRIGVEVGTQQSVAVDIEMSLGAVTEVVEVSEQVRVLESSSASGGTVLDTRKIADRPDSRRNPFVVAAVTPGVVPSENPQFNRIQDQFGSSMIVIAGGPPVGKNYYQDRIPMGLIDSHDRLCGHSQRESALESGVSRQRPRRSDLVVGRR